MTFKKHSFTNEDLRTIAIACGGVAFLIAVAVFLSPQTGVVATNSLPEANVAVAGDTDPPSTPEPDPVLGIVPSTDPLRTGGKSDTSWKQSRTLTAEWEQANFNDSTWHAAVDEGPFNYTCTPPSTDDGSGDNTGGGPGSSYIDESQLAATEGGDGPGHDYWERLQYERCLLFAQAFAGITGFPSDTPARWIWWRNSRQNGDTQTVYFRKTFVAQNEGAKLIIAGDDIFTAYLNGVVVSTGNYWQTGKTVNLTLTPGVTYTLAVSIRNTGGPGGLLVELDQSPKLSLTATSVVGKTTVAWTTENANDCAVAGPGLGVSGNSGTNTFYLASGQFPATYTLRCGVPVNTQKQVTVTYPSNWFTVYGGLLSYGSQTDQGGAQDLANRVLNGWSAPLGCEQINDSSEAPCFQLTVRLPPQYPPRTSYGVVSAFEKNNPSNGKYALFDAKNTGGRHAVKTWDATWLTAVTPTPTLTTAVGTPVMLEWSCVPYQYNWFEDECGLFGWSHCTRTYQDKNQPIALFSGSKGTNFSTGGAGRGYVTVTPPAGGETYTLTCLAANGTTGPGVSINVNKSSAAEPTLTIQALFNNVPLASNIVVGTPVVLHATYAAAPDDTITGAAINGGVNSKNTPACQGNAATCMVPVFSNNNKDAVLDYVFVPTAAGTYTFYPAAKTGAYESSGYVNYGDVSTQVTVDCPDSYPQCPNVDPTCPPGYVMGGSGVCVPVDICSNMPGDQVVVPENCIQVGTECLPKNSNYMVQGVQCVPVGVINSFDVNPPRVRKGGTVTFTWSVSNMRSCGIRGSDGSIPAAYNAANGANGTHTATAVVQQATNYVLSCTDGVNNRSAERLVNLIPAYEEI